MTPKSISSSYWSAPCRGMVLLLLALSCSACPRCSSTSGTQADAGVADATHSVQSEGKEMASAAGLQDLRWARGGASLLVGGRWLLDLETGVFSKLPYKTSMPVAGGGVQLFQLALDPTGEYIAVNEGEVWYHGPVAGPLRGPFPLPLLLPHTEGQPVPQQRSLLFWTTQQQLALYQIEARAGDEQRCALFNERTSQWVPTAGCPPSDFLEPWHVESGPEGWLAVLSGAEGAVALRVTRYTPDKEPIAEAGPSFNLSPEGALYAQFATQDAQLYLSTPCILERHEPIPCEGLPADAAWRLYVWSGSSKSLTLLQQGLPAGAVPHPSGSLWAWTLPPRVCVSGVDRQPECFMPPR